MDKLKKQSEQLKAEEADRVEKQRQEKEAARKAEEKRRNNDFEYLLNNTKQNWREFK
ncbi:YqkE family protein [Paenibacillus protaetiae]